MTNKDVFQMTLSQIRELADKATVEELSLFGNEIERRIAKRKTSGKSVTKKYTECLFYVRSVVSNS